MHTKVSKMVSVVVTATIALCTGCSPNPSATPNSTSPSVDSEAENTVRASADAMRKLSSAHALVLITGKFDRLGPINKVEADVQAVPLMANGLVTYDNGTVAPFVFQSGAVSVRLMNEWSYVGSSADFIPSAMIDPGKGLTTLLEHISAVQSEGNENIANIATKKVAGVISVDQVKAVLPDASAPAGFTAWIRNGADPVLVRAVMAISPQQSFNITLSKWNEPVALTPAPTS